MISIRIEAHPDRGSLKQQVDDSLAAIGFSRQTTISAKVDEVIASTPLPMPGSSDLSADKQTGAFPAATAEAEKPAPKPRGRPKKDETPAAPPAPEPEVEAQDAADEAEEAAAAVPEAEVEVFTRDSIRKELGNYSTAYGMEHALTDGPKIIEAKNASAVEETQEALGKAVLALRAAIVANPYQRAPADAGA